MAQKPEPGTIASVLHNVRRVPKRVRRQSRDFIETAVSQLFDAATRHPHGLAASGEYRIDDLARLAGTTTRNIRVYRDRGLLPPPLRVGRIALFNDTHLTRLRLITSMLDRGYNIAHVREMLSAWEEGKNLGDVLGLETAIVGTWTTEKPQSMPLLEAQQLVDDPQSFERSPRHIVGRADLIELYRGYGSTFFLDRCYDLRVHHSPSTSTVVLEYSSEGRVVATGQPYGNRYISVVVIKDRRVAEWRDYLDPLRVFAALEGRPFEAG